MSARKTKGVEMIDDGDKLKEKRQKGGNENTEPRPLVWSLLFLPLLHLLNFILIVSSIHGCSVMGVYFLFFFLFLRIRESELLSLLILDFHSC